MPNPWARTRHNSRITHLPANAPTSQTVRRANRRTAMKDQDQKVLMYTGLLVLPSLCTTTQDVFCWVSLVLT
ncbi:hypothetical protein SRB17_40620 [Streptomyces sp. RB17]|nr:hypothetical protein [Streptomyces sp. RB17]